MNAGIGGSTNAVVHLIAIARRVGIDLGLDDWDRLGRDVHCLVDIMPSGRYLMEDFFEAGGLPVVIRELAKHGLLHDDALTVNGRTIGDNNRDAQCWKPDVVAHVRRAVQARRRHRGAARQPRAPTARSSSRRQRRRI